MNGLHFIIILILVIVLLCITYSRTLINAMISIFNSIKNFLIYTIKFNISHWQGLLAIYIVIFSGIRYVSLGSIYSKQTITEVSLCMIVATILSIIEVNKED